MKKQTGGARRQRVAHAPGLPVERDGRSARQHALVCAFCGARPLDRKHGCLFDLRDEDAAQFLVRLYDQEMVWRLKPEPVFDAGSNLVQRETTITRELKKCLDQLIQLTAVAFEREIPGTAAHIDAAPLAKLDPAAPRQFPIGCAP